MAGLAVLPGSITGCRYKIDIRHLVMIAVNTSIMAGLAVLPGNITTHQSPVTCVHLPIFASNVATSAGVASIATQRRDDASTGEVMLSESKGHIPSSADFPAAPSAVPLASNIHLPAQTVCVLRPYAWETEDGDEGITIRAWCHQRFNDVDDPVSALLRIEAFPVFAYIQLPAVNTAGMELKWNDWSTRRFGEMLHYKLKARNGGAKQIVNTWWHVSKTLYYFQEEPSNHMIRVQFVNMKAMREAKGTIEREHEFDDAGAGGKIKCMMRENNITPVRRLLTNRQMRYTQWFRATATKAVWRASTLEQEWICNFQDIHPVSMTESRHWKVYFKALAFDIECYAHRHDAFPEALEAKDKSFMLSCLTKKLGKKEKIIRYGIIVGGCHDIPASSLPDVHVIRVNTELEMIQAFAAIVNEYDPDVLPGHNILGFDFKYLNARLERRLHEWPHMGRLREKKTTFTNYEWESSGYGQNAVSNVEMAGRLSIDALPIFKRNEKLSNYDLNTLGHEILRRGKHPMKAKDMFKIYEELMLAEAAYIAGGGKVPCRKMPDIAALVRANERGRESERKEKCEEEGGERGKRGEREKNERGRESGRPEGGERGESGRPEGGERGESGRPEGGERGECIQRLEESKNTNPAGSRYDKALARMTEVMHYCIRDSELIIDLLEAKNIMTGLVELSAIVGVGIYELFTGGQQRRVFSQLTDWAARGGVVIDQVTTDIKSFKGGAVSDMTPGVFDNIPTLDFASLYPSVIQAYNICYTTCIRRCWKYDHPDSPHYIPDDMTHVIMGEEEDNNDDDEKKTTVHKIRFIRAPKDMPDRVKTEVARKRAEMTLFASDSREYYLCQSRINFIGGLVGILPSMCASLVSERKAVKVMMKEVKEGDEAYTQLDGRQLALKLSTNSIFGFTGAPTNKLFCGELAASITAKGRELIAQAGNYLKTKYDARIIYGDTDSVMVDLGITDQREVYPRGKALAKEVSALFPDDVNIEFDKAMRKFFGLTKKRYASILMDAAGNVVMVEREILDRTGNVIGKKRVPKIDMKGIVTVRRDNCSYLRLIYKQLLDNILSDVPYEDCILYLVEEVEAFLRNEVGVKQLVITQKLGAAYKQEGHHLNVFANELRKIGKPAMPGDRLDFVVVATADVKEKLGMKMRRVDDFLEDKKETIDHFYYMKRFTNPIAQLLQIGYPTGADRYQEIKWKAPRQRNWRTLANPMKFMIELAKGGISLRFIRDQISRQQWISRLIIPTLNERCSIDRLVIPVIPV